LPPEVGPLAQRRKATLNIYPRMVQNLAILLHHDLSRTNLLQFLRFVANRKGAIIDRTEKRSREGMICWLCETAPELANPQSINLSSNTKSIEEVDVSKGLNDDSKFDLTSLGFDDNLRKEEEYLLLTLS
jgi:hypothetical protein